MEREREREGGSKRIICIRELEWTWRGQEEAGQRIEGRRIKGECRKSRGSGEEYRGSVGTGFVMLNALYLLPCSPALHGPHNSQVVRG